MLWFWDELVHTEFWQLSRYLKNLSNIKNELEIQCVRYMLRDYRIPAISRHQEDQHIL